MARATLPVCDLSAIVERSPCNVSQFHVMDRAGQMEQGCTLSILTQ